MRATMRWILGASVVLLGAHEACVDPTEVDVQVTTNEPTGAIAPPGTAVVTVGMPDASPIVSLPTGRVDPSGSFGDLVITPQDLGSTVEIRAALGVSIPSDQCVPGDGRCLVASARVPWALHRRLPIRLELDSTCLGVACGDFATCIEGRCQNNSIDCDAGVCGYADAAVPDAAARSIQLVGKQSSSYGSGALQATTVANAGDLLVAGVEWTTAGVAYQVSDSAGNAWTSAKPAESYVGANVQVWYLLSAKAGAITVTATPVGTPDAGNNMGQMFLLDYSGVAALDVATETFGPAMPTWDVPVTTQGASDLIIGFFSGHNSAANNLPTAGLGFSAEAVDPSDSAIIEDNAPENYAAPAGAHDVTVGSPAPTYATWAGIVLAFSAK